ncbi:FAD-dependent oxidoreductase [Humitalea rosea]|nr:FAD-dependent oxidoreductase [Humitalea rosea]
MKQALVLGAGIMGLSAAWGLRRDGWSVRVIDQDPIPNPRGASVDHHRLIRHAYGTDAGYMRMVDDAYLAWDRLWGDLGEALYVPTGVLVLSQDGGARFQDGRRTLLADGRAVEDLTPEAALARYPFLDLTGLACAYALAPGGVLLADRIVAALHRHLQAAGVVFEQALVAEVDPARATLRLADGSERAAELLVVAAGPWAPRLLPGLRGRVTASRQVLAYLEPPPALRAAWAAAPMLLDLQSAEEAAAGGFYAVPPVAGTPLKVGDHRFSLAGDAEDPRSASAAEIEAILAEVRPRLRDFAAYQVIGGAACYYDVEPRERFLLEPLGEATWVMSGFSGHGFKFGPLLGLALARAIAAPGVAAALPGWAAGQAAPDDALREAWT